MKLVPPVVRRQRCKVSCSSKRTGKEKREGKSQKIIKNIYNKNKNHKEKGRASRLKKNENKNKKLKQNCFDSAASKKHSQL